MGYVVHEVLPYLRHTILPSVINGSARNDNDQYCGKGCHDTKAPGWRIL